MVNNRLGQSNDLKQVLQSRICNIFDSLHAAWTMRECVTTCRKMGCEDVSVTACRDVCERVCVCVIT